MAFRAFYPMDGTITVTASTTASASFQVSTGSVQGYRVVNSSTRDAYLAVGASSTIAAAIPSSGASVAGMLIPGVNNHQIEYIAAPPNAWFSVIAASGTAPLYFTAGQVL